MACLEETQNTPITELRIILYDADALLTLKVNGLFNLHPSDHFSHVSALSPGVVYFGYVLSELPFSLN